MCWRNHWQQKELKSESEALWVYTLSAGTTTVPVSEGLWAVTILSTHFRPKHFCLLSGFLRRTSGKQAQTSCWESTGAQGRLHPRLQPFGVLGVEGARATTDTRQPPHQLTASQAGVSKVVEKSSKIFTQNTGWEVTFSDMGFTATFLSLIKIYL